LLVGLGITVRPQLALNFALAVVPILWLVRRRWKPLTALVLTLATPVVVVVILNSRATGQLTLLSENSGVNFFLAHCDGGSVTTAGPGSTFFITSPIYSQTHVGRSYYFPTHEIWDQTFFIHQGFNCIRADGFGHVRLLGRHVLDLTVTSIPWPQYDDHAMRRIVGPVNRGYGLILPAILVLSVMTFVGGSRNAKTTGRGERLLLLHVLCLLPTVVVFVSEPRYREPYDVFGLALVAALVVRFGRLDRQATPPTPSAEPSVVVA
jgi:hypothetical protein